MRERIYTIPIEDVMQPREGCPMCRMRDMLEERAIEYTMGAAMMEPDVRIEMNRQGFCERHLGDMLGRKNRLSLALMLQSHLADIQSGILNEKAPVLGKDKRQDRIQDIKNGCFVCDRIEQSLSRMMDTIFTLWNTEESFWETLEEQEYLCFAHFYALFLAAPKKLKKRILVEFNETIQKLAAKGIDPVKADIDSFCELFDYRSKPGEVIPPNVKSAPERAAAILTGRDCQKH